MFDDTTTAKWAIPQNVNICLTDRHGGFSSKPFDSFNLGDHVGDQPEIVRKNRALLTSHLPSEPVWLHQVHGCEVFDADDWDGHSVPTADAAIATKVNQVLAIMTADCLPVLLSTVDGMIIGAAHAGWRGLASGVIERTVQAMQTKMTTNDDSKRAIRAYLGAAIGPTSFEVGEEVRDIFVAHDSHAAKSFEPSPQIGKYMADIYGLAKLRLNALGIHEIYGGQDCTYQNKNLFSYRRDHVTGRMANLIWIKNSR